jgi:hypothetical protein
MDLERPNRESDNSDVFGLLDLKDSVLSFQISYFESRSFFRQLFLKKYDFTYSNEFYTSAGEQEFLLYVKIRSPNYRRLIVELEETAWGENSAKGEESYGRAN